MARTEESEDLKLIRLAIERKKAIDRGEMGTISLADMIAEFAPELAANAPAVTDGRTSNDAERE